MSQRLLRCLLLLSVVLLGGCTSFDRQWNAAGQGTGGATRWDGRWSSGTRKETDGSPHGGRLRCVLEPQPGQQLLAHFHANWLIFSGNYDLPLQPASPVAKPGKARDYRGTHDLPWVFGGTYRYTATIDPVHFIAHYTSNYDTGVFTLHRVPSDKELAETHAKH
jgi:hypothetical protein